MPKQVKISKSLESRLNTSLKKMGLNKPTKMKMYITEEVKKEIKSSKPLQLDQLSRIMAEDFATDLRRIISSQVFAWAPLSPAYAKRKKRLGLDPRILIATGAYIKAIQAMPNDDGSWRVDVPNTPLSPKSKYTLRDLAHWLEWGYTSGNTVMPPRPHWRPARVLWKTKIYQIKTAAKSAAVQKMKQQGFR